MFQTAKKKLRYILRRKKEVKKIARSLIDKSLILTYL